MIIIALFYFTKVIFQKMYCYQDEMTSIGLYTHFHHAPYDAWLKNKFNKKNATIDYI